jgi:hypothetical protein
MAIADMAGLRGGDHTLGNAMAGGDDQIEAGEIELFDGSGEKGKIFSIMIHSERETLNERCLYFHPGDGLRHRSFLMQESIQGGIRKKLTQNLQTFLPPSHPGQPIMD